MLSKCLLNKASRNEEGRKYGVIEIIASEMPDLASLLPLLTCGQATSAHLIRSLIPSMTHMASDVYEPYARSLHIVLLTNPH